MRSYENITCTCLVAVFKFCCLATNLACLPADMMRSRRDRRARQRDFIKAQETTTLLRREGDRMSIASNDSTSTCSSNGSAAPVAMETNLHGDNKYSSMSSLSDTESLGKD
jgi:hypothetical protein